MYYFDTSDVYLYATRVSPGANSINASLEPAAFITGTATGPISPLCAVATDHAGAIISATVTDGSGRYRIDSLPPDVPTWVYLSDCLSLPGSAESQWNPRPPGAMGLFLSPHQTQELPAVHLAPSIESIDSLHGISTTDWEGDGTTPEDPLEVWLDSNGVFWAIDELPPPPATDQETVVGRVAIFDTPNYRMFEPQDVHVTFEVISTNALRVRRDGIPLSVCGVASPPCVLEDHHDGNLVQITVLIKGTGSGLYDLFFETRPDVALADDVGLVDVTQGYWRLLGSPRVEFFYGNPGDYPFMGDWDCDGIDTPGLYRRSDGYVYLRNSNTQGVADVRFFFGNPGDLPLAGDFDGDGCDTVSIYRPSESRIYLINRLGANNGGLGLADYSYIFGNPDDKPFVGDFNGDGTDTIGLYRESSGFVYLRDSNAQGMADLSFFFGTPGDQFVAGDWLGMGVDTAGVYRGTGFFYLRHSNTQGTADDSFWAGIRRTSPWQPAPQMVPVAGFLG